MKSSDLEENTDGLRKQGKPSGVSQSIVVNQLAFRGYPKSSKIRFDPGSGVVNTTWIMGVRERRAEARVDGEAEDKRGRVFQCSNVPSLPQTISKRSPPFLVNQISLKKTFMEKNWNIGTLLHETKRPTSASVVNPCSKIIFNFGTCSKVLEHLRSSP